MNRLWEAVDVDFPEFRTEHRIIKIEDSHYIIGGYSPNGYQNGMKRFVESSDMNNAFNLEEVDTPQTPRRSAHSTNLYQGNMYTFGGWNGLQSNSDLLRFNMEDKQWQAFESEFNPTPRRSHVSCIYNGSMYIFGGWNDDVNNQVTNDVYRFDFELGQWSVEQIDGPRPCPRSRAGSVLYQNRFVVYGGWDRTQYFSDWWEYDMDNRVWTCYDLDLPPVGQHSMTLWKNQILIFAGHDPSTRAARNDTYIVHMGHPNRYMSKLGYSYESDHDDMA